MFTQFGVAISLFGLLADTAVEGKELRMPPGRKKKIQNMPVPRSYYVLSIGSTTTTTIDSDIFAGVTTTSAGTLRLSGSNTYIDTTTGAVLISGGSTAVSGGTLTLQNTSSSSNLQSGAISAGVTINTGSFAMNGAGTLTLSGSNTYSGSTTVSSGALLVAGGSTLVSAGTLTLQNTSVSSSLQSTVTGFNAPLTLPLSAAVSITGSNSFSLSRNITTSHLKIDGVEQVSGTWGGLESSAEHKTSRLSGTGIITVLAATTTETGITTTLSLIGASTSTMIGNLNATGALTDSSFSGTFTSRSSASRNDVGQMTLSPAPVPEPSSALLALFGAGLFALRRRRR